MTATDEVVRKRYKDRSGNSGVHYYAITPTSILVWFADESGYEYDHIRPGRQHVEAMERLAEAGKGLATYINQHVREDYARKLAGKG